MDPRIEKEEKDKNARVFRTDKFTFSVTSAANWVFRHFLRPMRPDKDDKADKD